MLLSHPSAQQWFILRRELLLWKLDLSWTCFVMWSFFYLFHLAVLYDVFFIQVELSIPSFLLTETLHTSWISVEYLSLISVVQWNRVSASWHSHHFEICGSSTDIDKRTNVSRCATRFMMNSTNALYSDALKILMQVSFGHMKGQWHRVLMFHVQENKFDADPIMVLRWWECGGDTDWRDVCREEEWQGRVQM